MFHELMNVLYSSNTPLTVSEEASKASRKLAGKERCFPPYDILSLSLVKYLAWPFLFLELISKVSKKTFDFIGSVVTVACRYYRDDYLNKDKVDSENVVRFVSVHLEICKCTRNFTYIFFKLKFIGNKTLQTKIVNVLYKL